ncbi:DUF4157 domain-containing protein [Massilia sp. P8910]|uniref:eCIS core domain-containing protein n=1 Tax=Massilia antarctica TaxID=2765360 RepID=UPI001E3461CF|nr:DUF4157 domain-containing protein [Massilia antarctica]MCE3604317.1 DUF4157 domain-containing protein [Massilia antarctica]
MKTTLQAKDSQPTYPVDHDRGTPGPRQAGRGGVGAPAHAAGSGTLQQMADDSARVRRQLTQAEHIKAGAQQRGMPPAQRAQSGGQGRTGLPPQLKAGVESLSGLSMNHVSVHYNSPLPAQLHAHAYAQGSEIHLGNGQEKHLPHEAWHVVQQAQGRVRPTMQLRDALAVNDDAGLEHEADVMGAKAMQQLPTGDQAPVNPAASPSAPLQLMRFARFSGWRGLNLSPYTSAEKELNTLEGTTVAAVIKVLDSMYKRHGVVKGSELGLDVPHEKFARDLTNLLKSVREDTFDTKQYGAAQTRLNNIIGYIVAINEYDGVARERAAHNKEQANNVVPHRLDDIPREKLWKTYLDRKFHEKAMESNPDNPGMLFDSQMSPGYQKSMLEALAPMLPGASAEEEKEHEPPDERLNYGSYTALHDAVVKYTANPEQMKKLGGREGFSQFATPKIPNEQGLERIERLAAVEEAKHVMISTKPLVAEVDPNASRDEQPDAVTLHSQDSSAVHIDTQYRRAEGEPLVNAILKLYYDGRSTAEENDAKLKRIVTAIRSLHIGHFFGDANGRLHMFVMLNKFLVEEGFSPAILPRGPDVFGGLATVDALVADVLEGMRLFHEETQ